MKPTVVRQDGGDVARVGTRQDSGLAGAALIMTLSGERPVAALRPGTRVVTRDTGTGVLRHIRHRQIVARAVDVRAGSFGHNRPERDTILSAGHPVLVRGWRAQALFGAPQALVAAERLVDGTFVRLRDPAPMRVHDLVFDSPHVLYVDGLELASAIDTAPSA